MESHKSHSKKVMIFIIDYHDSIAGKTKISSCATSGRSSQQLMDITSTGKTESEE